MPDQNPFAPSMEAPNPYAPPGMAAVDPQRTIVARCLITEEFLLELYERDMLRRFTWPSVLQGIYSLVAVGVAIALTALLIGMVFIVDNNLGKNIVGFGVPAAAVFSIACLAILNRLTKSIWRSHAADRLDAMRRIIPDYQPGEWTLVISVDQLTVQFPSGTNEFRWPILWADCSEALFKGILLQDRRRILLPVPRSLECDEPWENVRQIIRTRSWKWWQWLQ